MIHRIPTTTAAPPPVLREPQTVHLVGLPRVGDVLPCPRWPASTAGACPEDEPPRWRWVWVLRR